MAKGKANQVTTAIDQTSSILEYALRHLEAERSEIQAKIDHIRKELGAKSAVKAAPAEAAVADEAAPAAEGKKRVLSPGARKRIALAQKKRWAAHRKAKGAA